MEKIVNHVSDEYGVLYLVRWKGYGPQADTWEREEAFMDTGFVRTYHQQLHAKKERRKLSRKKSNNLTPVSDMSSVDTSTEDTTTENTPTKIILTADTPPDTPKSNLYPNEPTTAEQNAIEEVAMIAEPIPLIPIDADMPTEDKKNNGDYPAEWTVVDIINERRTHSGTKEYMVRWQKGTESYHSWELEYNLNCWGLLWKYHKNW